MAHLLFLAQNILQLLKMEFFTIRMIAQEMEQGVYTDIGQNLINIMVY